MNRSDGIVVPCIDGPCAFCDYLSGARPYTIAARSELVAVMVTREQRGIAHLLVLPVRHSETLVDATDEESCELMGALRNASKAISKAYRPAGIAVWQNNGTSAHQAIPHLHFHIAGTLPGGGTNWGEVPETPLSMTDEVGQQLRPYLEPQRWRR